MRYLIILSLVLNISLIPASLHGQGKDTAAGKCMTLS